MAFVEPAAARKTHHLKRTAAERTRRALSTSLETTAAHDHLAQRRGVSCAARRAEEGRAEEDGARGAVRSVRMIKGAYSLAAMNRHAETALVPRGANPQNGLILTADAPR